jgi:uncharacterized protein (DUF1330 family)
MPAYIMIIREITLDESRIEAYWSKGPPTLDGSPIKALASKRRHMTLEGPEVVGVVVAEIPSPEVARTWYENPAHQAADQRQFDCWLADMEYCDRF